VCFFVCLFVLCDNQITMAEETQDDGFLQDDTTSTPVGGGQDAISVVKLYCRLAYPNSNANCKDDGSEGGESSEEAVSPPPSMISPYCWQLLKDVIAIDRRVEGRALDSWCPYKFDFPTCVGMTNPNGEIPDTRRPPYEFYERKHAGFDSWCNTMKAAAKARLSQGSEALEQQQLQAQQQQYQAMQAMQAMQALQQQQQMHALQHQQQHQMHHHYATHQDMQQMYFGRPDMAHRQYRSPDDFTM